MTQLPNEDTTTLIQSYQTTSKALRTRAIVMSVLFLIILGLQHSKQVNSEMYWNLNQGIFVLQELSESKDLKKSIDSAQSSSAFLEYGFVGNDILQEQTIRRLKFDLAKSNYQDYTPLYELIAKYEERQKELGTKSGDYQVNVLGINTSFSNWLYFAPIILLLLFHDMTVTIFYRKSLREKLATVNVETWRLGSELFEAEHPLNENPTQRFLRGITTVFVIILLFLPLMPAFMGAISYMQESNAEEFNPFMAIPQWICPIIMSIELILIYYTENLLGMQSIFNYLNRRIASRPSVSAILFSWIYSVMTIIFFANASYYWLDYGSTEKIFDVAFFITLLFSTAILPISLMLLRRYPNNYWFRAFRIIGRCLMLAWFYNLFWVLIRPPEYLGVNESAAMGICILVFGFSAAFAGGFIWVFKKKWDSSINNNSSSTAELPQ